MTGSKTAMSIGTLAFALLFGGGAYVLLNLNNIAKPLSEKIASQALGVPVHISSMDIDLSEKRVRVNNIHIANPSGFSNDPATTIGNIDITLESISKEKIIFKSINVGQTNVNLEVKNSGTNLSTIQKNATKKPPKQSSDTPQIKVIIQKFTLTQAKLTPSITLLNKQDLASVSIPNIHLTGIGQKENGILAREAVAQIMTTLIKSSRSAAAQNGFYNGLSPEALKELGLGHIEQLKNKVNDEINKIKGLFN